MQQSTLGKACVFSVGCAHAFIVCGWNKIRAETTIDGNKHIFIKYDSFSSQVSYKYKDDLILFIQLIYKNKVVRWWHCSPVYLLVTCNIFVALLFIYSFSCLKYLFHCLSKSIFGSGFHYDWWPCMSQHIRTETNDCSP